MGLFDGLKMVTDIVKGGIASFKATEKMDALVERSQKEFDRVLTPRQKELRTQFMALKKKKEETEDIEAQNAMIEEVEAAEVMFLTSLTKNPRLAPDYRDEIKAAVAEYNKAEASVMDSFKNRMMKLAKDDEERAFVEQILKEASES